MSDPLTDLNQTIEWFKETVMPRGRQYYDPIIQVPSSVPPTEGLERIELFPQADDTRADGATIGKWIGRRITSDGLIAEVAPGDFDHDRALQQAQTLWPGLTVFELRSEQEDSTWNGSGPSPRLWQAPGVTPAVVPETTQDEEGIEFSPTEEQVPLRVLPLTEPGTYVLLDDIRALLEMWAVAYEIDKNPSAALALREAVDALKDVG